MKFILFILISFTIVSCVIDSRIDSKKCEIHNKRLKAYFTKTNYGRGCPNYPLDKDSALYAKGVICMGCVIRPPKKLFGKKVFHEGELLFKKYGVWTVVIAAFTPFPFKLVTWLAGMFEMRFSVFVLAVALGRIPRFFLVAYGGLYLGNLF